MANIRMGLVPATFESDTIIAGRTSYDLRVEGPGIEISVTITEVDQMDPETRALLRAEIEALRDRFVALRTPAEERPGRHLARLVGRLLRT